MNPSRVIIRYTQYKSFTNLHVQDKVSELLTLQRRLYRSQDGTQPELIKPGRELLKQGELKKLSRRGSQPRYFVLVSIVHLMSANEHLTTAKQIRILR